MLRLEDGFRYPRMGLHKPGRFMQRQGHGCGMRVRNTHIFKRRGNQKDFGLLKALRLKSYLE